MTQLIFAILLGGLFGAVLHKVGASNPQNIINMLRLKDLRLMKTILFAIGFSSFILFALMTFNIIDAGHLSVKASHIGVVIGGAILGIGFAISGYCPGTGLVAASTGRKDAWWFILGGLLGAFIFTLSYEAIKALGWLEKLWGGKVTLAATGKETYPALMADISPLLVAGGLGFALMIIAWILPKER